MLLRHLGKGWKSTTAEYWQPARIGLRVKLREDTRSGRVARSLIAPTGEKEFAAGCGFYGEQSVPGKGPGPSQTSPGHHWWKLTQIQWMIGLATGDMVLSVHKDGVWTR